MLCLFFIQLVTPQLQSRAGREVPLLAGLDGSKIGCGIEKSVAHWSGRAGRKSGEKSERERERQRGGKTVEGGSEEGKVESVSQERFIARGQSARRTGLFQEQSVNPH